MNLKLAKFLRQAARNIAKNQGLPERLLVQHLRTGQIINHPKSERGVYLHLKKFATRIPQHGNTGRTEAAPGS